MENIKENYHSNSVILITDSETEAENDAADDPHNKCVSKIRPSLLNLSGVSKPLRRSNEFESDEKRILDELKNWNQKLKESFQDLKKAKENHNIVDWSLLPKEKREFLEQQPDLTKFLRGLREARLIAHKFMENDYPVLLDLQHNIITLCKQRINLAKENKYEEMLSNN